MLYLQKVYDETEFETIIFSHLPATKFTKSLTGNTEIRIIF